MTKAVEHKFKLPPPKEKDFSDETDGNMEKKVSC
jgi:hypothetical protein